MKHETIHEEEVMTRWGTTKAVLMEISFEESLPEHLLDTDLVSSRWIVGYLRVPSRHPWYRRDYNRCECPYTHGSLTFGEKVSAEKCAHIPLRGWVVGFDMNHYSDVPKNKALSRDGVYRQERINVGIQNLRGLLKDFKAGKVERKKTRK